MPPTYDTMHQVYGPKVYWDKL